MASFKSDFSRVSKKRERQDRDLQLWYQWDQNGRREEDLSPLFKSFRNRINSEANKWSSLEIPKPAVKAEFQKKFVQAVKTYNPQQGKLNTWIGTQFRQANRFLQGQANAARIAESRVNMIGPYKDARTRLEEELGREPNTLEIANRMGAPIRDVEKLQRELRASVTDSSLASPQKNYSNVSGEILRILDEELDPEELFVLEHTAGLRGKPKLPGKEIARRLGKSPSKVTRVKQKVAGKVQDLRGLIDE